MARPACRISCYYFASRSFAARLAPRLRIAALGVQGARVFIEKCENFSSIHEKPVIIGISGGKYRNRRVVSKCDCTWVARFMEDSGMIR